MLTELFWDTEELGRRAKLCSTKLLFRGFSCVKCKCICVSSFCVLTGRAFWRAEQLRWAENKFEEMRKVDQCSDEVKTVEKNFLRWHVRGGGRWEELRWGEMRRAHMIWDEMKCGVWSVKSAVWSVRKVFAWRCVAPGSRAGHVLVVVIYQVLIIYIPIPHLFKRFDWSEWIVIIITGLCIIPQVSPIWVVYQVYQVVVIYQVLIIYIPIPHLF